MQNIENQQIPIPFFVINLSHSKNRKQHMTAMLQKLNVDFRFVQAVDGKKLSHAQIEKVYDDNAAKKKNCRSLSPTEIGCALSHLKIYHSILKEKLPAALILEDDVQISNDFLSILKKILTLKIHYDVVLFAYSNDTISFWKRFLLKNYYLIRFVVLGEHRCVFGALAYLVSAQGAKKILSKIGNRNKLFMPIDHYTGNPYFVNLRGVFPPPVTEGPLGKNSTIMNRNDEKLQKLFLPQYQSTVSALKKKIIALFDTLGISILINCYATIRSIFKKILMPPTPKN